MVLPQQQQDLPLISQQLLEVAADIYGQGFSHD
jgi:hypothetical protein